MKNLNRILYTIAVLLSITLLSFIKKDKPTIYLIGDSTVSGGWGKFLYQHFDTTKVSIQNRAVSGTSSRTYYTGIVHDKSLATNGMWKGVLNNLKPGDYVMVQFGHNDDSPVIDTLRARGSRPGIGEDSIVVKNHFTGLNETVHTYGWYLRKFVSEAKKKNAFVIICSPVPKDKWKDNKVVRINELYGKWSAEAAASSKAFFINLNDVIADIYDKEGEQQVSKAYFTPDHVHPNTAGSMLTAKALAEQVRLLPNSTLRNYLK